MSYPREDYQTNSVDGAAAFERGRAARYDYDDIDDDYEPDVSEAEDNYDDCNCSDPTCPCSGFKRGIP